MRCASTWRQPPVAYRTPACRLGSRVDREAACSPNCSRPGAQRCRLPAAGRCRSRRHPVAGDVLAQLGRAVCPFLRRRGLGAADSSPDADRVQRRRVLPAADAGHGDGRPVACAASVRSPPSAATVARRCASNSCCASDERLVLIAFGGIDKQLPIADWPRSPASAGWFRKPGGWHTRHARTPAISSPSGPAVHRSTALGGCRDCQTRLRHLHRSCLQPNAGAVCATAGLAGTGLPDKLAAKSKHARYRAGKSARQICSLGHLGRHRESQYRSTTRPDRRSVPALPGWRRSACHSAGG
jgi:hypothetical protein